MKRGIAGMLALVLMLALAGAARAESVPQAAIQTRESVFRVLGYDEQYRYSGSSFVIASTTEHTYFATNYHVVEDSDTLTILLHNGAYIDAQVAAYDESYDICILKTGLILEAPPLALHTGEEANAGDMLVGRAIYAVGYPASGDYFLDELAYRQEDATITNGIVSAVKHVTFGTRRVTLLQMNAAINSGNSGGPLVDSHGSVLGINTLGIDDTQGMFGAVSTVHLVQMMNELQIPVTASSSLGAVSRSLSPWAVAAAGIAAGLVCFLCIFMIARRRRATLQKLMERRLQGYSPEQALEMLLPVMQLLEEKHQRGQAWGGIDQHTLYLYRDGTLTLAKPLPFSKQDAAFKPVELYESSAQPGVYSDVYALGIALYCLISNRLPESALQRLQEDTLPDAIRALELPSCVEEALLSATLLDQEVRIHDVIVLQEALELREPPQIELPCQAQATLPENVIVLPLEEAVAQLEGDGEQTDQLPGWLQAAVAAKEQLEELAEEKEQDLEATVLVVAPAPLETIAQEALATVEVQEAARPMRRRGAFYAMLGGAALLLLLGGALLFINSRYRQAELLAAEWSFAGGQQALAGVPDVYRDTRRLRRYLSAGESLDGAEYHRAKEGFAALRPYRDADVLELECEYREAEALLRAGIVEEAKARFTALKAYRDSSQRILECDYRKAELLLGEASYTEAADLFQALVDKGYREAEDMLLEVDYQRALDMIGQQAYADAFALLNTMPYYKDSAEKLEEIAAQLYAEAEQAYVAKELKAEEVLALFMRTPDYAEAQQYMAYINLSLEERKLPQPADRDYAGWQNFFYQSYLRRMEFWEFAPAREMILQSYFGEFLYGRWEGEGNYFESKFDEKTGYAAYTMSFPGGKGKSVLIQDHVFRTTGDGGRSWEDGLRFSVVDRNTMDVYSFAEGKTYRLVRQ